MLRSIAFKNLINFKEKQVLEFQDGVNFLIGANSTGKSSICELIRRCHSFPLSSSLTNLLNDEEPGYIVSRYEGCSALLEGFLGESSNVKKDVAFLCYFHEREKETNKIYKCVCFNSKIDGEIFIAVSQYGNNLEKVVRKFPLQNLKERSMKDFITAGNTVNDQGRVQKSPGEHRFLEHVKQILDESEGLTPGSGNTSEDILEKLQTTFACVFPIRSFGPMQWINGNNVGKLDASKNYHQAHIQAEILWDLLPVESHVSPGGKGKVTSHEYEHIDVEKERSFFSRVTYPLEYKFKKIIEKREIEVIHENEPSPKPRPFELLKAPEGIVEAKHATLVLSHRKLKTICYEDIERGMHNQMTENLNNFVLKEIKGKTVIVVSHNPALLNRWALERTHVCSRQKDPNGRFVNIVRKVPNDYACKYGINHEMKKVLFSACVLLVEGPTELHVLRSFFDYILSKKDKTGTLLGQRSDKGNQSDEDVLRILFSLQVISLGSNTQIKKAEEFCRKVKIFVKVLADNDEKETTDANQKKNKFMWQNGTIEDALRHDCPETVKEIVQSEHGTNIKGEEWETRYKNGLKNAINDGLSNETYEKLFGEIFTKIERNEQSEFMEFFKFIAKQD